MTHSAPVLAVASRTSSAGPGTASPQLAQRSCKCGGAAGPDAECEDCRLQRLASARAYDSGGEPGSGSPSGGASEGAGGAEAATVAAVDRAVSDGGKPMEAGSRRTMEKLFQRDLSAVRIHADRRAAASANEVGARAFAVGRHLVFAPEHYRPRSPEGRSLLAHELTHAVQQGFREWRPGSSLPFDGQDGAQDGAEAQARRVAGGRVAARRVEPLPVLSSAPRLQRERGTPVPPDPTCHELPGVPPGSDDELTTLLEESGVIHTGRPSSEFSNILYRHVHADTSIGRDYLAYLRRHAYPMADFCVRHGGQNWARTFTQLILPAYGLRHPRHARHAHLRRVEGAVRRYALDHLEIYVESELYPEGQFSPAADPLTPAELRQQSRGTLLTGPPPEAMLLLAATDDYLTDLTLSTETVSAVDLPEVTRGTTSSAEIYEWEDPTTEGTHEDANRFDQQIVYWTRYYNQLFDPRDRRGRPNPLDPDLFKALMMEESRFNPEAVNPRSGARGLTGMLRASRQGSFTASGELERGGEGVPQLPAGISGIDDTTFANPAVQIAAGIRWLFHKYEGSRDWATAVRNYNGDARTASNGREVRDNYRDRVMRRYRTHRRELETTSTSSETDEQQEEEE
ncbi:MAG: DUF4157 domain-containing protein [Acidobacteriota bacterium]|nr:DUF4157 domain-containing protein [Acidobacteriota bacterium]